MAKSMKDFVASILELHKNAANYTPEQIQKRTDKIIENITMKKGGWIQRARASMERRGTVGSFTEYCGGKVTSECIERGLKSKDPKIRRRAAFAKSVRSFKKRYGGTIDSTEKSNKLLTNLIYMAMGGEFENDGLTAEDMSQMSIDEAREIYNASMEENDTADNATGPGNEPKLKGVKRFLYREIVLPDGKKQTIAFVQDKKNDLYQLNTVVVNGKNLTKIKETDIEKYIMDGLNNGELELKFYDNLSGKNVNQYMKKTGDSIEASIIENYKKKDIDKKEEGGEQSSKQDQQTPTPEFSYDEFVQLALMYPEYVQRLFAEIQKSQQQQQNEQQRQQNPTEQEGTEEKEEPGQEEEAEGKPVQFRRFEESPEQEQEPVGEYLYGGGYKRNSREGY